MQKIDFIRNLKRDHGTTMLFFLEKSEETVVNFSENTVNIIETFILKACIYFK